MTFEMWEFMLALLLICTGAIWVINIALLTMLRKLNQRVYELEIEMEEINYGRKK